MKISSRFHKVNLLIVNVFLKMGLRLYKNGVFVFPIDKTSEKLFTMKGKSVNRKCIFKNGIEVV